MRTIQMFILRLLVDPSEPETLRGALKALPEGKTELFTCDQALLALLRRPTDQVERRGSKSAEADNTECSA